MAIKLAQRLGWFGMDERVVPTARNTGGVGGDRDRGALRVGESPCSIRRVKPIRNYPLVWCKKAPAAVVPGAARLTPLSRGSKC